MRDNVTHSEWLHYTGECIMGPETGATLESIPAVLMGWRAFRESYPHGTTIPASPHLYRRIMAMVSGHRNAPRWFNLPSMFRRTMRKTDDRLQEMDFGLGVVVGRRNLVTGEKAQTRFYPLRQLSRAGFARDTLGSTVLVLCLDPDNGAPMAWEDALDGVPLGLQLRDGKLVALDGSVFLVSGLCVEGARVGRRLKPALGLSTRWYGFAQTYPDASVWSAPGTA